MFCACRYFLETIQGQVGFVLQIFLDIWPSRGLGGFSQRWLYPLWIWHHRSDGMFRWQRRIFTISEHRLGRTGLGRDWELPSTWKAIQKTAWNLGFQQVHPQSLPLKRPCQKEACLGPPSVFRGELLNLRVLFCLRPIWKRMVCPRLCGFLGNGTIVTFF